MCKLLGITYLQLRYRRRHGQIRAQRFGGVYRYPADEILRQQRETQARLAEEPGERDAIAVAMVNDGASDGEIIQTLKLSLERVAALRAALRKDDGAASSPGAPPAARSSRSVEVDDDRDEARIRERYEARRELLAARRRAGYAPEPPPPLPKRKG